MSQARCRIADTAAVRKVVEWMVAQRDTWAERCAWTGVSQPVLWRLANERARMIEWSTVERLSIALSGVNEIGRLVALWRAVLTPFGDQMRDHYFDWCNLVAEEHIKHRPRYYAATRRELAELTEADVEGSRVPGLAVDYIGRGLAKRRIEDMNELLEYLDGPVCGDLLLSFTQWTGSHGIAWSRHSVALMRIIGPLLEGPNTAFIERQWQELTDKQLRAFVKAGIAREKILLDRAPDEERIQQVLSQGPRALHARRTTHVRSPASNAEMSPAQ